MKCFYQNNLKELEKLATDIKEFSNKEGLTEEMLYALNLCLDEVVTNIISYSESDTSDPIELHLTNDGNSVTATVKDSGKPFNPILESKKDHGVHEKLEKRIPGGLGTYFLDQYMDEIHYKRENNQNILTLKKEKKNHLVYENHP